MHKRKAGKLQSGSTFPKQYWLAVNGKPKTPVDTADWEIHINLRFLRACTLGSLIQRHTPCWRLELTLAPNTYTGSSTRRTDARDTMVTNFESLEFPNNEYKILHRNVYIYSHWLTLCRIVLIARMHDKVVGVCLHARRVKQWWDEQMLDGKISDRIV